MRNSHLKQLVATIFMVCGVMNMVSYGQCTYAVSEFTYKYVEIGSYCQKVQLNATVDLTNSLNMNSISYQWDYGNGQTSTVKSLSVGSYNFIADKYNYGVSGSGTYTATLTLIIDCGLDPYTEDYTYTVSVGCYNINAGITSNQNATECSEIEYSLTNIENVNCFASNTTVEYRWNLGDGTVTSWQTYNAASPPVVSHKYHWGPSQMSGSYNVSIEFRNTCNGSAPIYRKIKNSFIHNRHPNTRLTYADFSFSMPTCTSTTVNFINHSVFSPISPMDELIEYYWDFGDGTAIAQNPSSTFSHVYSSPGTYKVTLIIVELYDSTPYCERHVVKTVEIGDLDAVIQPTAGCQGSGIQFNGLPAGADTYYWEFGDGSTSSLPNPLHNYPITTSPVAYQCTLTVTRNGCSDQEIQSVTAHPTVSASITGPTSACGTGVTFSSPSTGITSFAWDFGNGTTGSGANPSPVNYTAAGFYTVTLTVSNGYCSNVTTHTIEILEDPEFSISAPVETICPGEFATMEIEMDNFLNTNSYTFEWFDANNNLLMNGLQYTVSSGGTYTAVVTANGCSSVSHSQVITAHTVPNYVLDIDPQGSNCIDNGMATVKLSGSVPSNGENYDWGHCSACSTATVNDLPAGPAYVVVTTTDGCSKTVGGNVPSNTMTLTTTITNAGCGASDGEIDLTVTGGASPYTFEWTNSAMSIVSTSEDLTSVSSGEYDISVTDDDDCIATLSQLYISEPIMQVTVSNLTTCGEADAKVLATATVIGGPAPATYTFTWMDDGNPATTLNTQSPSVNTTVYELGTGNYTIKVGNGSCVSQVVPFSVTEGPDISLSVKTEDPKCFGDANGKGLVGPTGGVSPYTYEWYDNNPTLISTSPLALGLTSGNYSVEVADSRGCLGTTGVTITAPNQISGLITGEDCDEVQAEITSNTGTPDFFVAWIRTHDPSNTAVDPNQIVYTETVSQYSNPTGLTPGYYKVRVIDANGCMTVIDENYEVTPPIAREFKFKYVWTGDPLPEKPSQYNPPKDIAAEAAHDMLTNLFAKVNQCINKEKAQIKVSADICMTKEFVNDQLAVGYNETGYLYTLYYYDRAGNLTKTVPPQGVGVLAPTGPASIQTVKELRGPTGPTGAGAIPSHSMESKYDYNSLGQLIEQTTPDGGITKFIYNDLGQLRFSYNEYQEDNDLFAYTKYDEIGRIVESGEASLGQLDYGNLSEPAQLGLSFSDPYTSFPTTDLTEVNRTYYSVNSGKQYYGKTQQFLNNRISHLFRDEDGDLQTTTDRSNTYFSYDPHGNVEWMIQDLPGITSSYVRYEYDLVSGNVKEIFINEFREDRFFQRYEYDADNRILAVETSRNGHIWDRDSQYEYFRHGPLKRTAIGEDQIQGIDYVYTIQGWLKAINEPDLSAANDPGTDGDLTTPFAGDVFGMTLNYFDGDFNRTGSIYNSGGTNFLIEDDLFNGNISGWVTKSLDPAGQNMEFEGQKTGRKFTYDQLNRLTESDFEAYSGGWSTTEAAFDGTFSYDQNGNLKTLTRNELDGNNMDNLVYTYTSGKNQLASLNETSAHTDNGKFNDIFDDDPYVDHAYTYDKRGNLIQEVYTDNVEVSEDDYELHDITTTITWNALGKVKSVTKNIVPQSGGDPMTEVLNFKYDPSGNRIRKEVIRDETDPELNHIDFYLRDAQGNVLTTYRRTNQLVSGTNYNAVFKLREQPIYGSDRLGQINYSESEDSEVILAIIPFDNSITDEVEFEYDGLKQRTELAGWYTPANAAVDITTSIEDVCDCELKKIDLTNHAGTIDQQFMGLAHNNLAVAEDIDGNLQFYAVTAQHYMGHDEVCLIYDHQGKLMKSSHGINSTSESKSMIMQDIDDEDLYYLITRGSNRELYYSVVDMSQIGFGGVGDERGEVTSKNTALDPGNEYGRHMAIMEDGVNNSYRIYTTRHSASASSGMPGTTQIVAFEMTSGGTFGTPVVLANLSGNDDFGDGEIQLSADGTKLLHYNHKLYIGGFAHREIEVQVYALTSDGMAVEYSQNYTMAGNGGGNWQKGSADFTAPGDEMTFSQRSLYIETAPNLMSPSARLEKEHSLTGQNTTIMDTYEHGDTRRAIDRKNYVAGQENTTDLAHMDLKNTIGNQSFTSSAGYQLSGHLPGQNIRKRYPDENGIKERKLGLKQFEMKDHLGNVRVVFSDHKLSSTTFYSTSDFNSIKWNKIGASACTLNVLTTPDRMEIITTSDDKGAYFDLETEVGQTYHVSCSLTTSTDVLFGAYESTGEEIVNRTENTTGTYDIYFTATGSSSHIRFIMPSYGTCTLQTVSFNVMEYVADVQSIQDYYPFGMVMPGRSFTSDDYRYGFNGMEKDDEIKGAGNSLDFGARIYDARIGRWLKMDNIEKSSQSSYQFSGNSPIVIIDPDGNTEFYYFGKWIGTDGKDNNLIASVTDRKIKRDIKRYTKDGLNYPVMNTNLAAENVGGILLVNRDVLKYSLEMLDKSMGSQGKVGEYYLTMDKDGDNYSPKGQMVYTFGQEAVIPKENADVLIHSHPTGLNFLTGEYVDASKPSEDEPGNKGDESAFKNFKTNIIVGLTGEVLDYSTKDPITGKKALKFDESNRFESINIFTSNYKNRIGWFKGDEARKILDTDKGRMGRLFQKALSKKQ